MQERELRASLVAVGPLLPVLIWHGRVVDGRKRDRICEELGLVPRVQTLHSLAECCSALWAIHRDRAVAEALAGGAAGVTAIAELCSARVADVALVLSTQSKKTKVSKRSPRRTRSTKTEMVQFWTEPQLKHFAKLAGATESLDLSGTIRVALWEYVQRHLPRAPREGGSRAPSEEWVKPPERRRTRGPTSARC